MTKFKKNQSGKPNNFRKKFNKFNRPDNKNGGGKKEAGKKKKPPVNLVFDPEARMDFLTGFHKRKLEKKQHYKIKLQKQIQEEKQRIQAQVKKPAVYKSSSHSILPEVEALLAADDEERNPVLNNSESFEVGSKTVIISSIDPTLHAPLHNTNENDSDEDDDHDLDLEGEGEESGTNSGIWKTKTNKKGKSKVIYKSDTNKLLQNSGIYKKIQKLKQKSKKGRPKPNPHFKPKVAPGSTTTKTNDSKGKGSSSKNNLRRKGKQKGKGHK